MSKSSLVNGSKNKSGLLSNATANSVLATAFKTNLSTNPKAARQLSDSGINALCEAYSKGITTQQIAEYLGCSLYAVLVYESGLKAEDKELLNQAKLQHALLAKQVIASLMDAELARLDVAREMTSVAVGSGIAGSENKDNIAVALGSEDALSDIVLKKAKALKIRADMAESDINRYSKASEKQGESNQGVINNTIVLTPDTFSMLMHIEK